MELIDWARTQTVSLPTRSDAKPKRIRLKRGDVALPDTLSTDFLRALGTGRSPGGGAISIESVLITGEQEPLRALALVFLAYALSEQQTAFRLSLAGEDDELSQIVIWPSTPASVEGMLGCRQKVVSVGYKPRLPKRNPNYTTTEQDDEHYPREHLPYCRIGWVDAEGGEFRRPGLPSAAHFKGTRLSLIWMGHYLANLALTDNHARLAYLYNLDPAESLCWNSAELRFTVCSAADGPKFFPPSSQE